MKPALIILLAFLSITSPSFAQKSEHNKPVDDKGPGKKEIQADEVHITPGSSGVKRSIGYRFTNASNQGDPGNGLFRYDNETSEICKAIIVDDIDISGEDQTNWFSTWDDTTGAMARGQLTIADIDGKIVNVFNVTGLFLDAEGFWQLPVEYVTGTKPVEGSVYYYVFERIAHNEPSGRTKQENVEEIPIAQETQVTYVVNIEEEAQVVNNQVAEVVFPVAEIFVVQETPVPVTLAPETSAVAPVPIIVTPTPVIETPAPIIVAPTPVIETSDPVIVAPTPVIETSAPVIVTPTPVIEIPAPVIVAPTPVIETPVPVIVAPTPVVETSAPVIVTPALVIDTPAPFIETPAQVIETPTQEIDTPTPVIKVSEVVTVNTVVQNNKVEKTNEEVLINQQNRPVTQPAPSKPVTQAAQAKPVTQPAPTKPVTQSTSVSQKPPSTTITQAAPVSQPVTYQNNYVSAGKSRRKWYSGIIEAGYAFGVSDNGINNFRFNFINGFKIGKYSSLGLGIGYRQYFTETLNDTYLVSSSKQIPVFIDFRKTFSARTITPYFALGLGGSSGYTETETKQEGLFFTTSGGLWLNVTDRFAVFAGVAYELQELEFSDTNPFTNNYKKKANSVSLNIGISF